MTASHDHADHEHGHDHAAAPQPGHRHWKRWIIAIVLVVLALTAAGAVPVKNGEGVVITRLGAPVRVVTDPGLTWMLPAPIERAQRVDRRVQGDGDQVLRFVRATGGDGDAAANQLRTLLNSALETVSGRFALTDLVNTDASAVRLAEYETALRERLAGTASETLGVELVQVGIERLLLPDATLQATVTRMSEERRVAAEERQSAGRKAAGEIKAMADKESRIAKATAEQEAAVIEAKAKAEAAGIYGTAYTADPELYVWLRSLDTLETSLSGNSRLILATDAPPFQALVSPPPKPSAGAKP
jgi:membrane protease subunit HflC